MLDLWLAGDTETDTSTFHFSARKPDNRKLKWMLEQYIQTYSVSSLVRPVNELIASDDMLFPSRILKYSKPKECFNQSPLPSRGPPLIFLPPSIDPPSLLPPLLPPPLSLSLSLDQSKDSDHFYDEVQLARKLKRSCLRSSTLSKTICKSP